MTSDHAHRSPTQCPRLIALDMDGTLLDGDGNIPESFWQLLATAQDRGIAIAPASGRQLATLRDMFSSDADGAMPSTFIAENGTVVFHRGEVIDTTPIAPADVHRLLTAASHISAPHDIVLCSPECAFTTTGPSEKALEEMGNYYHALAEVDDLSAVADSETITKVATLCFDGTEEHVAPIYERELSGLNIAVSGQIWVDVMAEGADKGAALRHLADKLEIAVEDTAAFGDFLNDYELLQAAGTAVAMDNGHQKLKDIADRIAPPNTEHGVIQVLEEWLG
ncbi:HAD family hydrolase [Corynebacterium massiliense]|uniref:HAD family hydrolase n=1 Tax=Corynebacterium massiliense TaxID=441501 RepID=UPI002355E491|nr:HAD family hydrolase [Corynebacterium massiliense]